MAIDVAALLEPVSEAAPSGEAVEYDGQFIELETLARGTPAQEVGDTIIPGEEPNWREVESVALELAARSKDLRVGNYLVRAELKLAGLPGMASGIELIRGYIEKYWASVHPQLDPDDDNDPSGRINALASLCDAELVLRNVRAAPLTQSRSWRVTYRDHAIATGLLPMPPVKKGEEAEKIPDSSAIDAAFADSPLEALQGNQAAVAGILDHLTAIEDAVSREAGGSSPDFDPLKKLLREIKGLLDHQLARREGAAPVSAEAAGEAVLAPSGAAGAGVPVGSGAIRSRSDVALLLDKICRYYAESEPSSPVPMLLERAKRLATMSFMDILQDLTPDGVHQFRTVAGIREEEQQ